jgi:hypothetical protein
MEDFIIEYEKTSLRTIEWFDKITGNIVGQEELKGVDLMQLREIFNVTVPFDIEFDEASDEWPDPHMIEGYDVDLDKARLLQPFITHKIDLEMYIYQIGCCRRENT